jgi:hypothetical protein
MNAVQHDKFVPITPPGAIVDNASLTTATIDTAGFAYLRVLVVLGATDIAMTALKLQESDNSGMSGAADITGLIYGTSAGIAGTTSALPTADDDDKCFTFEVDLRGRKRYIDLVATVGNGSAGTYITAFALLSRASDCPVSASERGYGNILRV